MSTKRLFLLLGFTVALLSTVALGQVRGVSARTIGVEEIMPGMRGYGLTVFRGTQPERFDVEVIDILHNFRPDQDLILIRVDNPILEAVHVVGGMSGSPIYFDNRLAGAYAYGWPFSQDPVAGVTPIANMLTEMRRPLRPEPFPITPVPARPLARARSPRTASLGGLTPYLGESEANASTALDVLRERFTPVGQSNATMRPAATPLMLGGFDDAVVEMLGEQLEDLGMIVLQAGGSGQVTPAPNAPTAYVDGGAVAVELVRGDVTSSAVGTVTHVEGNRACAFGHPMVSSGQTQLPTSIARILHILSSQQRSFKIAEPVRPLGALVHDRQSAVVIDDQVTAPTVPVHLRIEGVPDAPRSDWNFEVASHRVLTPVLINASLLNAMRATAPDGSDVMFEATSRVTVSGRATEQVVTDRGFSHLGPGGPNALGSLRLFSLLESIYGNPYEEARAESVDVVIHLRFAHDTARIVDASVTQHDVDPGSVVPVRVVIRRFDQTEEVRVLPVRIPDRLAGQDVEIYIQAGSNVSLDRAIPRNLDELLATVHERYSNTSIVVSLETRARGLRAPGHVVEHLPASALDALQLRNDGDRHRPFLTYERTEIAVDQVVDGAARVELTVRATPRGRR